MPKKKLQHFAEINTFENVFQHSQQEEHLPDFHLKGKWNKEYFKNENPVVLELGCGKGEYTIGLAQKHPHKNFIGIDLKGNRIWKGAKTAIENKMANVAFLRIRIENIETVIDKNEISEIWVTFPDPQPQKTRERKRLTSPRFLDHYKNVLIPGGIIHLKTDNYAFYEYTIGVIKENYFDVVKSTSDLYAKQDGGEASSIKTFYEKKFLEKGSKICYLKLKLN